ncbi:MAG: anthranilate phosphoribosyltransferase [Bryobacteraceae bacterium]
MSFVTYLHRAVSHDRLTSAEARAAMELILSGDATTAQIAAFLTALRMKGETADELYGFALAMRGKSAQVPVVLGNGEPLLDTCGTGGDGLCTFNISTVAAFVVAGCGVKVAKHGNRSISSHCGSADILEGLGVNVQIPPERVAACIHQVGIGFLFAPAIHPAMKHAQPARLELQMRTAFNMLGPLTNPAGATIQLVGASSLRSAELIAEALGCLGLVRGFVVHGADGLDEITTTGETVMLEVHRGAIAHQTVTPEDFGVPRAAIEDLKGGDREANCVLARSVLEGKKGPKRDVVLVNASAALVAAGTAPDYRAGVRMAAQAIDSGAAYERLERMIDFTRS